MSQAPDLYAVLGVESTASMDEIRKAFRRQCRQCHPDHHPGDLQAEERFKELSAARDILSNPDKRRRYDAEQAGLGTASFDFGGMRFSFHGGFRPSPQPLDIRLGWTISLQKAFEGGREEIRYWRWQQEGTERRQTLSTLHLPVPKRCLPGSILRLDGHGHDGADGKVGRLEVQVQYLFRQGQTMLHADGSMRTRLQVPWQRALRGEEIEFPLFEEGRELFRIRLDAPGRSGRVYRLAGQGMPPAGDVWAEVFFSLPKKLNEEDRDRLASILDKYDAAETIFQF
jgi:DnaJ-class molecular chaperone